MFDRAALRDERLPPEATQMLRESKAAAAGEEHCYDLHSKIPGIEFAGNSLLLLADDFSSEMDKYFGDVDFDRADFITRTAE